MGLDTDQNDTVDEGSDETLRSLFPEGQIRLAEISVFNWGTFSGLHTGVFDAEGTLVTGHTGAGKSTFIDAIQPLMLRPRSAHFNVAAAQADKADRSLLTYLRGRLGSEADSNGRTAGKYKRPGAVLGGLRTYYRSEAGNDITLIGLFWISADGTSISEIHRGYVVANRNLGLKEVLDTARGEGRGGVRWSNVDNKYKGLDDVKVTQSFDVYEARYMRALYIEEKNAPALLARAMGLKKIDDLTKLVRAMVLEEPDTRKKALAAIEEFNNLNAIHAELDEATRRDKMLAPLPGIEVDLRDGIFRRKQQMEQRNAAPFWYAAQRVSLIDRVLRGKSAELQDLQFRKTSAQANVEAALKALNDAIQIYRSSGGDDLETLRENLARAKHREDEAIVQLKQLEMILRRLKFDVPEHWTPEAFDDVKERIRATSRNSEDERQHLAQLHSEALIERNDYDRRIQELQAELGQLETRPGSAIDGRYQKLREQISEDTGILIEAMPFVGELIDIKPDQAHWQGAIERALGFIRLRFLIEEKHKKELTSYVNREHLGLRVGFEVVKLAMPETEFRDRSFLRKLQWSSKHPFNLWLKRYLSEQTLDCYDTREEMLEHPFSMTASGLIQRKLGSFDKNDNTRIDDRSKWYTGFSSEPRKAVLRNQIDELKPLRDKSAAAASEALGRVESMAGFAMQSNLALELDWKSIDVVGHHKDAIKYQSALQQIENTGLDIKKAEADMNACEQRHNELQNTVVEIGTLIGGVEQQISDLQARRERSEAKATPLNNPVLVLTLQNNLEVLTEATLDRADDIEREMIERLQVTIDDINRTLNGLDRQATTAMTKYKSDFKIASADLPDRNKGFNADEAESLQKLLIEWVEHYHVLVDSRLPELRERFQESLNRQATQSLTAIRSAIETQYTEINERIDQINHVLERTEFRVGSYLSLVTVKLNLDPVRLFDEQLRDVIKQVGAGNGEAHFNALKTFIVTLQRATDPATRNNLESLCQLDARYRMDYAAREWRHPDAHEAPGEDGRVEIDFIRDTSGKSGGEKESFSGMIVAASLAYVLTPAGAARPSYSTVFLDEAFSNTSDERSKRVLAVFKELGLHLNLITPFKNVELARKAVRSALIVEMESGANESSLTEVTWEEIDRMKLAVADFELQAQARRLGAEFESAVQ